MGSVSPGWDATYGGRLLSDKIVEMTIGKLSYEFCRSLPSNDLFEQGQCEIAATGANWRGRLSEKGPKTEKSKGHLVGCPFKN